MKKFLEYAIKWKTYACLVFTGFMMIVPLLFLYFGGKAVPIAVVYQVLLMAALCSLFKMLAFSDLLFKRLRYGLRLMAFMVPFFCAILLCAVMFHWFPATNLWAWITFVLIFLVLFFLITLGYEIYFRVTGRKYNFMLEKHRKK